MRPLSQRWLRIGAVACLILLAIGLLVWWTKSPTDWVPPSARTAEGKWTWLHPELVEIPASYALQNNVWFQVVGGVQGVLVEDTKGKQHVYVLNEPASHYYQVMTRNERMPVFMGDGI